MRAFVPRASPRDAYGAFMNELAIVNRGRAAWAFSALAEQLSAASGVPVRESLASWNYVLGWETDLADFPANSFIPKRAIELAGDKRALAKAFAVVGVPTPETHLVASDKALGRFADAGDYCLKYPTGVGASGHRLLSRETLAALPGDWPRPFVVQAFIRLDVPEVYRVYAVAGECAGYSVRRYAPGGVVSPWVSHANGARYEVLGEPPTEAWAAASAALHATSLHESFGCVDLLRAPDRRWLVLEVGTDGVFNHVDRDVSDDAFVARLHGRIASAFRAGAA